ncbi:MAG TPA: efflux RND transporter periplasmic adaptor subunit [Steroidobacteraceae bacterium]|nr:efflux RND transporter periplasmic adaptor subunit [Steroidobacteraceae bacterium]HRX90279.1 efflux RND transporter periplasmic adaptor subunit [Steroidobacteraceae bacterium]
MLSRRFNLHITATLLLASTSLLPGCSGTDQAASVVNDTPALTVTTVTPVTRPLPRTITASGSVTAWQEISLGVELSSVRVARVLVDVGQRVKQGQRLIEMDARSLQVDLNSARARLAEADAALVLARANAERGRRLKEQQLISAGNADELIAGEARAEAQRQSAVAQLESARLRLSFATVRAPENGVISARSVDAGQIVSPNAELLKMIREGRLEWRGELSGADLARARVGTEVRLHDPTGAQITGKVRSVAPSLDPRSRTGLVYADIPQPGELRAGMFVEGELVLGDAPALIIPRQSVVVRDGMSYVFVVGEREGDNARVRQQRITTGATLAEEIAVQDGLDAQAEIVFRGAGFLSDGDLVAIAKEGA